MGSMGAWAEYERWNEAVLEVMFPALDVPEPVYLDFEAEQAERLATLVGAEADDVEDALAAAVAATLASGGPSQVFARHMHRTRVWIGSGRHGDPPFVALLATFCVAAERMQAGDGMAASNYFGRLRALLGWPDDDHRLDHAYRRVAERLWGELNRWLLDLNGQRGLPTAFSLTHRYVGLTVSQALVRSGDREHLRDFFRQHGFAPGAEVAPSELEPLLDGWIAQRPSPVSASLARLWKSSSARPRIAQAAAVALAGWDGQVRERAGRDHTGGARGHLVLTLEVGTFPRRRLAVQVLAYLPEPRQAREATVLTASPEVAVELVPDVPGALGLGRGTALDSSDVLEGFLRLRDSLTGSVLEHRPRRLVLFREDELSRKWIESPQVMLGEDARLLVHHAICGRVEAVLGVVARPGWERAEPYPGQPEDWVLYERVAVFNNPGPLVDSRGIDDLAPLVPLTSSQLKVAGGFSLPGSVRGKWHSWAPPEIRAVSDAPQGFVVRLVDLNRYDEPGEVADTPDETLLEEWHDGGTGVVVRTMSDLELADGDYRVELVSVGETTPLTTTTVLLRSADTPDRRQWALLDGSGYSPGLGVLGVPGDASPRVAGHVVDPLPGEPRAPQVEVPDRPGWSAEPSRAVARDRVVRLTRPDPSSCIYTGRHVEHVETVPTDSRGKPLVAWVAGRCKGCGLERRYPTRLRRSSFDGPQKNDVPAPAHHELADVAPLGRGGKDWTTSFDALLHTGGGTWSQLERIAFQLEPSALFLDDFARTLEVLGHIDVRRDPATLEPVGWEVTPTALAGGEDGFLFSGYWPAGLYSKVGARIEESGSSLSVHEPVEGPASYFADCPREDLRRIVAESGVDVALVDVAWRDLVGVLPTLGELVALLPRQSESLVGEVTWYQPRDNAWVRAGDLAAPGAYRVRRFSTVDVVRTPEDVHHGTVARSTVQLSKHVAALLCSTVLMAYDRPARQLFVPLGADLPGLYGRAAVAASGSPPIAIPERRALRYDDVPVELAHHLYHLLSR